MYRTLTCNDLTEKNVGDEVTLSGWVNRRRDHGGVIFIDLRDRYGLTQVVSHPENHPEAHGAMDKVRSEFVIQIKGKVIARPEGQTNNNIDTGKIEVEVSSMFMVLLLID